jgi:predicted aconitase
LNATTATLGRYVQSQDKKLGYTQKLESFGVNFINDTF